MRRLEKDESLCIGCHQCEEACSKAFYKVSDPMKSCIRITDKEDGSHHIAVCTQCGKCSDPVRLFRSGKSLYSLPQTERKSKKYEIHDSGL